MKRRSPWHDYSRWGYYMLTLEVNGRVPLLGRLMCEGQTPYVECSALGQAILEEEQQKISRYYPMVEVVKLCIMPDHLHMIVRIREDMPEGRHLGHLIAGFKSGCNHAYWRLCHIESQPKPGLFAAGYNDRILLDDGQMERWKTYLDDNPRRLWVKRQNPQFFSVMSEMEIAGQRCQCVGNRFLLDIPDKVAVIVHRRYTEEDNARLRDEWLACGERGGVLVSAAVHPREKAVMREAKALGYRTIDLCENGFPPLYKPMGEAFDACAEGRLLQLSPWQYHMERKVISRAQCLALNQLAEAIAGR